MADLAERLAEVREHVNPGWTPERERAVRAALQRRIRATRRRRALVLAAAVVFGVAGALVVLRHRSSPSLPASNVTAQAGPAPLLRLEDGTTVAALGPDARVGAVQAGANDVTVPLAAGAARFTVTPNVARPFHVVARAVTVTVLGTVFSVTLEPDAVRVAVERGRVRVDWPAGTRELGAGEEALVPDAAPEPPVPSAEAPAPAEPAERAVRGGLGAAPSRSWRDLAENGDYAGAYARMTAQGPSAVRDEPGELLLAADVARLGGHPEKAIAPLTRVVSAYAADSRAPLAAFTLGRTLLDQLGRPHEAADAFATARRLSPRGALAQDALAREVESWSRAGDASRARERAEQYLEAYPKGRRTNAVRRLGGLD